MTLKLGSDANNKAYITDVAGNALAEIPVVRVPGGGILALKGTLFKLLFKHHQ